jgi:HAD superfamily hydrolase (TIGR01509 family)
MDGTLVDTEPYWIGTEFALAAEYDAPWSHEDALDLVGNDLLVSGEAIRTRMGLPLSAAEVVERLLDGVVARVREEVPWRPGARELLAGLGERGVPCALVTMSWTRFVEPVLDCLPPGSFAAVVTGDRVSRGKPHPEPYLAGAAALGLDPGDCLALEDSPTGARSAASAGCRTLVVPCAVPVPDDPRWGSVSTLVGLDAEASYAALPAGRPGA